MRRRYRFRLLDDTDALAGPFAVHSAVLTSGKVIMWSGHAELGPTFGTLTALYDPATDTYTTVPFSDTDDLFCSGHTFLSDGRLIAGGGANQGQVDSTHIFDPTSETWSHVATGQMNNFRWYPTMVAMNDGRTAILSGTPGGGTVADIEVIDMAAPTPAWQTVTGGNKPFTGLYPGFHWLPSGDMFFTRTGWNSHTLATNDVSRFTFSGCDRRKLDGSGSNELSRPQGRRPRYCSSTTPAQRQLPRSSWLVVRPRSTGNQGVRDHRYLVADRHAGVGQGGRHGEFPHRCRLYCLTDWEGDGRWRTPDLEPF